jgi:DNA-binding response OmpR family regulator
MRVLIIEDDDRIALPIKEDLERQHHFVDLASDGKDGLERGLSAQYDVIILDLMLPKMGGMSVCTKLRQAGCTSAIIMTTARRKTTDKIQGLDCGADDYLAKPFEVDELMARIRAVLRRGGESRQPVLTFANLALDSNTHVVKYSSVELNLTPMEYRLLEHFLSNPSRAYTKEELIDRLWPSDQSPSNFVIKTHIKGLRKKLLAVGAPGNIIETVYGVGYRLKQDA